jgi:predicted nucleotidyltransferase
MVSLDVRKRYLDEIREALISLYGENLVALVIFGSAARGDFEKGSDLDLLVILRECENSMGKRIDEFMKVEWELRKTPEYQMLKAQGLPHRVEAVILSLEEFQSHPPLLLDLTTDAKILIDKEGVFSQELDLLRCRLKDLGARKVILGKGRWYWILKPNIKWGENVIL